MVYWRLNFWWYLDRALQLPVVVMRRIFGPLALACCRRYLREFARLEARGLLPIDDEVA